MDSRPSDMKGIITPLSSLVPAEEAQKAAKLVEEKIAESKQHLSQLKGFIDDNVNLIILVHKLPDEISHHIMVLLGDGYYADRTSKQTAEILKRRDKALETQDESLKAIMKNLMTEASFFGATAFESAEGLVDIREDYEEGSSEPLLTTAFTGSIVEHTHIVSKNSTAEVAGAPSSIPVSRFKLQRK